MTWPGLRGAFELAVRRFRNPDHDLQTEFEAHIALRTEHLIERGWSPEAARHEALERFGDLDGTRRSLLRSTRTREGRMQRQEWFASLKQDLTGAVRQIGRAPGFSLLSVLTLGLGVGLTTAVFAVLDGVLLRPLPFERPEQLVALQSVDSSGRSIVVVSADNWHDWARDNRTLGAVSIYATQRVSTAADGGADRRTAAVVPAAFFPTIRPRMVWGRPFSEAEAAEGAPVVVIGEHYWRHSLGGRTSAAHRVLIDGRPATVVGVVAAGQEFPSDAELWIPYHHQQRGGGARNNVNWYGVGRLRDGVSVTQAVADLSRVARSIRDVDPVALYSYGVEVTPLRDHLVANSASTLHVLMTAVVLVLLIGCANLASANLARGAGRRREMAVRIAIGAGRGRVLRQIMVEHLVLAMLGGGLGVLLAWLMTRFLSLAAQSQIPRTEAIVVDPRILGFGLVVAVLAGLLTALLPGLQASSTSPHGAIVDGARGTRRWGRGLPGQLLVGTEIALALMLVAGAGLLIQSLRSALDQPLGFDTEGVVTAEISLNSPSYRDGRHQVLGYWDRLGVALAAIPGVEAVGYGNWTPLGAGGMSFVEVAGKELPGAGAGYQAIGGDYFRALGIPLVAGRGFAATDDTGSTRVAVISRLLADRYFGGDDPLGAQIRTPGMEPSISQSGAWYTVVGVVGDVRRWGHETEPRPEIYVPYRQATSWAQALTVLVRGPGGAGLATEVKARAAAIDPLIPADVGLLSSQANRLMAPRRFAMLVLTGFGILALGLAAIGVYGVLSFAVAERAQELGIRSALGASRQQLLRQVLASGSRIIVIGLLAGHGGAALMSAVIRSELFGVSPRDPVVLAVATAAMAGIGILAAWLPARRAAATDPMTILRKG